MTPAAAYIRVSTEDQLEYSPESQLKLIKEYASKNGYILTHTYSDEGISGRNADKRPQFKKMIADAKTKAFDAILIYSTSRFARNHEESTAYRALLKREGVDVISITQPPVDYKTDILLNAIYAVMDERYSIDLSENVKRGMKEKVSRGIYISCAPFGYRRETPNRPLVIDEAEAAVVRWVFDEYKNGDTLFSIALALNAKGYKSKRGNPFGRRDVRRMLTNVLYKGWLSWVCDGERFLMPADHMPIIDTATFEAVQARLEETTRKMPYKAKDPAVCTHYLTGAIRCQTCGTTYVYRPSNKTKNARFVCGNSSNAMCTNYRSIRVMDIERIFLDYLERMPMERIRFSAPAPTAANLSDAPETGIERLNKILERAKAAYLQGVDTLAEYERTKADIKKEIDRLARTIAPSPAPSPEAIVAKSTALRALLVSDADTKTKNIAVRSLIEKIVLDHDAKTVTVYFWL